MRTQAHLMRTFESAGDFKPLTAREYDVLFNLAQAGGVLPMKGLVANALLSQPSMSRMVDRLAARGYVIRAPSPSDRRAVDIELTDSGWQMQRTLGRRHVRTITKELAPLTDSELADLTYLCSKLRRNAS